MGIFDKIFNKKKVYDPVDFSPLKTDIHSHLIPGVDDGSKDLDNSIELIEGLMSHGFTKIITTPHIMSDLYPNTRDILLRGHEKVCNELQKRNINVEFEVAAEYFFDEHFEMLIEKNELMTFGDNYVLFELPFGEPPIQLKKAIFDMQMNGYTPVIAHPERYTYWHKDKEVFHELHMKDVILQLNINSLSGAYSPQVKQVAEKLVEEKLIKLLGSDTHHMGHIELLGETKKTPALHQLVHSGRLINASL